MQSVAILGGGRMGITIARDLSHDWSVTIIDSDAEALVRARNLVPQVRVEQRDLTNNFGHAADLLKEQDLLIVALPGLIAYRILEKLIELERPIVDISFFPENPFALSNNASERRIAVAIDCGLAPGLCNLLLGRHLPEMEVSEYRCLVGGLPVRRTLPFQYKAPFSPRDVIEEYTRPVRLRRNGKEMTLPPLPEPEHVEFPEIGTLEAFNTDGLRTLLTSTGVLTMIEKTLRYPGHRDQIEFLRAAGFLESREVDVQKCKVRPLEVTSKVLEEAWRFQPGEPDITLMRVEISGRVSGQDKKFQYELVDRFDPASGTSSMSRTTGFTCAAIARLMLDEVLVEPGLWPPERIGQNPQMASFVLDYLAERGVIVQERPE